MGKKVQNVTVSDQILLDRAIENLDAILAKVPIDIVVKRWIAQRYLNSLVITYYDLLNERGANLDMQDLVDHRLAADSIAENLNGIVRHGGKVDMPKLLDKLSIVEKIKYFDRLKRHGAKIYFKRTARQLEFYQANALREELSKHGYTFERVTPTSCHIRLIKLPR